MIKVGLLSVSLFLLAACGDSEPVATTYKKSMAAGAPAQPATSGTGDATALAGATLYNSKCAGCHGAIATSAKKGATAARITAASTIGSHASIAATYPSAAEAASLEAALK